MWLVVEILSQDVLVRFTRPHVIEAVHRSPFWSHMADESTDSATMEQLGVYIRYIDLEKGKLCEKFLEMKPVEGHPTAQNMF